MDNTFLFPSLFGEKSRVIAALQPDIVKVYIASINMRLEKVLALWVLDARKKMSNSIVTATFSVRWKMSQRGQT